jgi:cell division protein FtsI (penicillin-binding protein 3)
MLRGVVTEGGTGQSAGLQTYELAGKTGTARQAGPGGYATDRHTAVFAALFPAEDPQLVTVVKLDAPRYGYAALSAAPLTRRMLEQALAARATGIDRGKLARDAARLPVVEGEPARTEAPRAVVAWPRVAPSDSATPRRVPNVTGLSPREAVARLHRAGFAVRLLGLGEARRTEPAAGSTATPGTVITVHTETRRAS